MIINCNISYYIIASLASSPGIRTSSLSWIYSAYAPSLIVPPTQVFTLFLAVSSILVFDSISISSAVGSRDKVALMYPHAHGRIATFSGSNYSSPQFWVGVNSYHLLVSSWISGLLWDSPDDFHDDFLFLNTTALIHYLWYFHKFFFFFYLFRFPLFCAFELFLLKFVVNLDTICR